MKSIYQAVSFMLVAAGFSLSAVAKEQAAKAPPPPGSVCVSAKDFSDFDFWVGEWSVYSILH